MRRDRDRELAEQLLDLVHRHGWQTTFAQLEAELTKEPAAAPGLKDLFLGWMASERGLAPAARSSPPGPTSAELRSHFC
jgi:hypothetical protein